MNPRDLLQKIYLFRDASAEELEAVAAIAESKSYLAGEYVYHSGDVPDALFVIQSGTIDVTLKDQEIPTGSIGSGQSLGEMAFFERSPRIASALTRERTYLLHLPFAKLDQVLLDHPELARKFYFHACVFCARLIRNMVPDLSRRYF